MIFFLERSKNIVLKKKTKKSSGLSGQCTITKIFGIILGKMKAHMFFAGYIATQTQQISYKIRLLALILPNT